MGAQKAEAIVTAIEPTGIAIRAPAAAKPTRRGIAMSAKRLLSAALSRREALVVALPCGSGLARRSRQGLGSSSCQLGNPASSRSFASRRVRKF